MEIVAIHQEITAIEVDAIVRPAAVNGATLLGPSSQLLANGGPALVAVLHSGLALSLGCAVLTAGGALRCRYLIHVATVSDSNQQPSLDALKKATLAALKCAEDSRFRSLAFPNMGFHHDSGPRARAARAIVMILKGFDPVFLNRVLLVDPDVEMIKHYEAAIDALSD